MSMASKEHGHKAVHAFLWGLLPDNPVVVDQWGKKFKVSSGNAFRLLWHVGEVGNIEYRARGGNIQYRARNF